jgi:hypothetical protein
MTYCNSDGQQLFTTKRITTSDSKPLIYGPKLTGLIIKGEGWDPINRFNY